MSKIIIYSPGMGIDLFDVSMVSYANRFTRALDRNDNNKDCTYKVNFDKIRFSEDTEKDIEVATIKRLDTSADSQEEIVYRIYGFDYEKKFTKSFKEKNILMQSFYITIVVFKMIPVFLRSFFIKGLSRKQKLQGIYFFFLLVMISSFVFFLLPSLIAIISDNITPIKTAILSYVHVESSYRSFTCVDVAKMHLHSFFTWFKDFSHTSVPIASAVALLYPQFQKKLLIATSEYLTAHYYLKYGDEKTTLTGNLAELIEKICETETNYTDIEIHAYSFGSIIAIDTLFPQNTKEVNTRIRKEITQLVTIGCPFDFIRVYYPHYFKNRCENVTSIKSWYNINCTIDVLSSNFRNDNKPTNGDPLVTPGKLSPINVDYDVINSANIGFIDYVFLMNFKVHRMYWDKEVSGASFFTNYLNTLNETQENKS